MKPSAAQILVAVALAAVGWGAGCSKSKPEKQPPAATSEQTPSPSEGAHHDEKTPAGEAHEHGTSAEKITPGETIAQIWMQIGEEQRKLEAAIQAGQLGDVHHLAFAIRDLAVALSGKVTGLAPADAVKLQDTVNEVRGTAAELDEEGDAGNLGAVKEKYAHFQQELEALKALTGAH